MEEKDSEPPLWSDVSEVMVHEVKEDDADKEVENDQHEGSDRVHTMDH